ncbi:MAG: TIGR03088 family PEP-CTERM/XrtA system glycosyltransferase [Deltaproteobacteria bacterium]|nr:TIGR03088 family PEP-CTERM/XrtA system glycosyltransferase [Deltaproteobacteria bacterium]
MIIPGPKQPPLVAHIVYRFAVGGLENGLVNLINHMSSQKYRHAIISLTDSTDFRARIEKPDVPIFALCKKQGQDFGVLVRLWRLLRRLRPDIVHTRNLPTLECLFPAAAAGVRARLHGEHGRDVYDLDGSSFKYNFLRRIISPLVHGYTAVSADLAKWLAGTLRITPDRVAQIYNGVDTERFKPRNGDDPSLGPHGFAPRGALVIGTVGRMETVKDQLTLVRSFIDLLTRFPESRSDLRLVLVGEGALREQARQLLAAAGAEGVAWLPGERGDIPQIMRGFDLFVLPSLAEGISNTILEAMASGLPVVATHVGGNPELVDDGRTGTLVPPADPSAMAEAIRSYVVDRGMLLRHGEAGRKKAELCFSIEAMVNGYQSLYDNLLRDRRPLAAESANRVAHGA